MPFEEITLFNPQSWQGAGLTKENEESESKFAKGHSVIKITPNHYFYARNRNDLVPVIGVTTEGVSIGIESEWNALDWPSVPAIVGRGALLAGGGALGSVYMSKKLWHKNGYLRMAPKFRIVDWDGTGKPIFAAYQLAKFALPGKQNAWGESLEKGKYGEKAATGGGEKLALATQEKMKKLNNGLKNITEGGMFESVAGLLGNSVESLTRAVTNRASTVNTNVIEDAHDYITLKNAPPPVMIQIGQFFYHPDMIITNVNFDFSLDMSEMGPLYVDITLELSSRKIMSGIDDIGFTQKTGFSRGTIDNTPQIGELNQEQLQTIAGVG